jgi:hypothetical protein
MTGKYDVTDYFLLADDAELPHSCVQLFSAQIVT